MNKKRSSPSLSSSPWCLKQVWFKTIHGYILHLSSPLKIKTCLTSKRGTIWMEFHCQQTKSKHVLSVLMSLCQFSWMWWFGDKRLYICVIYSEHICWAHDTTRGLSVSLTAARPLQQSVPDTHSLFSWAASQSAEPHFIKIKTKWDPTKTNMEHSPPTEHLQVSTRKLFVPCAGISLYWFFWDQGDLYKQPHSGWTRLFDLFRFFAPFSAGRWLAELQIFFIFFLSMPHISFTLFCTH